MIKYFEQVYNFHELYNKIADLQQRLPQRKGNKDYSIIENEIFEIAHKLIQKIWKFKQIDNDIIKEFIPELNNIDYGCEKVLENPYKTRIHRKDLSKLEEYIHNLK